MKVLYVSLRLSSAGVKVNEMTSDEKFSPFLSIASEINFFHVVFMLSPVWIVLLNNFLLDDRLFLIHLNEQVYTIFMNLSIV